MTTSPAFFSIEDSQIMLWSLPAASRGGSWNWEEGEKEEINGGEGFSIMIGVQTSKEAGREIGDSFLFHA